MSGIHTCSYSCERPECIKEQRDELAARLEAQMDQASGSAEYLTYLEAAVDEAGFVIKHDGGTLGSSNFRLEPRTQPTAVQKAVAWLVGDEFYPSESLAIEAIQQWGPSGAIAIPLYAAASVAAAPGIDLEQFRKLSRDMRKFIDNWDTISIDEFAHFSMRLDEMIDASPKGNAQPVAGSAVRALPARWFNEKTGLSAIGCANELTNALAKDDAVAGTKDTLPALPDDFSESKDWRAGNYAERVEWLMDTVRSQRGHIDALLDSPKGGSEARAL